MHGLHGVWRLLDLGTLGNTLSECVTKDPRVGTSEACAIHLFGCVAGEAFIRLCVEVSPSVVHVGTNTNDKSKAEEPVGQPKINY